MQAMNRILVEKNIKYLRVKERGRKIRAFGWFTTKVVGLVYRCKSQSGQHKEFVKRDALTWRRAIGPDASLRCHLAAASNRSAFAPR
jgi:hypothetical protein